MKEDFFDDYNKEDVLNSDLEYLEEYNEDDIFYCMNCSNELTYKELYKQKSDLYPYDEILICIYCGSWVE